MPETTFGKQFAGMGNHDSIVGTQETRRQQQGLFHRIGKLLHGRTDLRVGSNTTGHDDAVDPLPVLFQGLAHLQGEGFGHGKHVGRTHIAQGG